MAGDGDAGHALTEEESALWRGFIAWTEHVMTEVERALTARSGLSAADLQILLRLQESGGSMLQLQLQSDVSWTATRSSHQLRRMEERGLIERSSAGTGRAMRVALSDDGAAVLDIARGPHAAAVRRHLLEPLTDEQRRVLVELVRLAPAAPRLGGAPAPADPVRLVPRT